jgi:hypothetical protein
MAFFTPSQNTYYRIFRPYLDDDEKTDDHIKAHSSAPLKDSKLHTFQVPFTEKTGTEVILKVVKTWKEEAQKRLKKALEIHNKVSRNRLLDSCHLLDSLAIDLSSPELAKEQTLYIAYRPQDMTIQGIATCKLSSTFCSSKLLTLLTHPHNIPLKADDLRVHGAGTALIKHIAENIYKQPAVTNKNLSLTPFDSAKKFYEKLGFVHAQSYRQNYFCFPNMLLTPENGDALIKKWHDLSAIDTKPPNYSDLQ